MLNRMKKPELLITQKVGEVPVRGICSACPHIVFDIGSKRGKRGDHERKLKKLFSEHLKKVHAASVTAYSVLRRLSFHQAEHAKPASADREQHSGAKAHLRLNQQTSGVNVTASLGGG